MPPMPGSIARGPFMRALQSIANQQKREGLEQLREQLLAGEQHVDIFRPFAQAQGMGEGDIDHLARHWYMENPRSSSELPTRDERWWGPETNDIVRFGLIRGIDLLLEAIAGNKKTYVDCVWICRGDTVEVANLRSEHEGTMYLTVLVMTPPIPVKQAIVDGAAPYRGSDDIWLTRSREATRYGGLLMPGFGATRDAPPGERARGIETVELLTVGEPDPRYAAAPSP